MLRGANRVKRRGAGGEWATSLAYHATEMGRLLRRQVHRRRTAAVLFYPSFYRLSGVQLLVSSGACRAGQGIAKLRLGCLCTLPRAERLPDWPRGIRF